MKKGFHTMTVVWLAGGCEERTEVYTFPADEFQIKALAALAEIRDRSEFVGFLSFDISQPKKC